MNPMEAAMMQAGSPQAMDPSQAQQQQLGYYRTPQAIQATPFQMPGGTQGMMDAAGALQAKSTLDNAQSGRALAASPGGQVQGDESLYQIPLQQRMLMTGMGG